MKKIKLKNSRNQTLVANFYTSKSKSIIIMSHGIAGDKSEGGKFDRIAQALNQTGFNVLALDFSGFGESDDEIVSLNKMIDDLKSIINHIKTKGYKKIGLLGWSLGGLISLNCFENTIKTMLLWAPITDKLTYSWWRKKNSSKQLKSFKEDNKMINIQKNGLRKKIVLDYQLVKDLENIEQNKLLKEINCPVLIIHGKQDKIISYKDSETAIKILSKDSKLKLVEKTGHGFNEHLDIIIKASNSWFMKHLNI